MNLEKLIKDAVDQTLFEKGLNTHKSNKSKTEIKQDTSNIMSEAYVTQAGKFDLKTELLSQKTKKAHQELLEGYVKELNTISSNLDGVDKSAANVRRRMAFSNIGINEIPHNLARHSFASYHCALDMSASKTAMVLGHTSEAMLWNHYKGIATKTDAKKYFAIKP